MNTTKILTIVNIYYPSIYHALAKYACNSYRKCTGQVLNHARSLQSANLSVRLHLKSKAILLLGIALLHMFSLSAQTPRKDSGADELKKIIPLSVGEQMPEYFWDREYLFYENGDTTRRSISEFKGKLLVLDFWATWCAICIGQMKETESLFSKYPNNVKLLFVNPTQTNDNYGKILKIQNRLSDFSLTGRFHSIIEDDYLNQLFPNHIYPRYAWIGPYGDLIALTTSLSVTSGHVDQILNLLNMNNEIK